jgi:Pentapeptide repeats (8 copies)
LCVPAPILTAILASRAVGLSSRPIRTSRSAAGSPVVLGVWLAQVALVPLGDVLALAARHACPTGPKYRLNRRRGLIVSGADILRGNQLILTLAVILVVLGASLVTTAWRWADRPDAVTKARREMLSSLGASLLTGAVLAVASLYLQEGLSEANEETTWRSNIINTERLVGFSAEGHDMQAGPRLSFAGKQLIAPDFTNSDLTGVTFRDAVISGADFTGANLTEADFVGATITSSKFNEAILDRANLMVAQFVRGDLLQIKSMSGAKVNANTCWPNGFLHNPGALRLLASSQVISTIDGATRKESLSKGYDTPCRPRSHSEAPWA